MKKQTWTDTTSYSHREATKKTAPRSWSLGEGHLSQIKVHRHMGEPDRWFLTCYALKLEQHRLLANELEDAKVEALRFVSKQVKDIINYYKKLGVEV